MALNIGGIANVTVIPAGARPEDVFAFDTGPGNMVVDALVARITRGRQSYDRNARMALRGQLLRPLIAKMLRSLTCARSRRRRRDANSSERCTRTN